MGNTFTARPGSHGTIVCQNKFAFGKATRYVYANKEDYIMSFINDEAGATAIEYGALTALGFALIMSAYLSAFTAIAASGNVIVDTLSVS